MLAAHLRLWSSACRGTTEVPTYHRFIRTEIYCSAYPTMNGECNLLQSKFDLLHADFESSATDTAKLAFQLYSRAVVSKGVRGEVEGAATPGKAASKLLGAVENRIETHPHDFNTFLECLATFPTWQHHADDMTKRIKEIEELMVHPQPVSDPATASSVPGGGQPVDIRLIISSTGVSAVPVGAGQQQSPEFVLRSAPIHRKHPQQATASPPQSTGKPFPQASSPLTNSSGVLSPDQSITSCASSTSSSVVAEEAIDNRTPPDDGGPPLRTPSLRSQTSNCSTFEEGVVSMRGSLDELLTKYCNLRSKLRSRDRQIKAMKAEMASDRKAFDAGIGTANQETKDLRKQVDSLQDENSHLKETLETTRESVLAGNRQKKQLMDQLQDSYDELKRNKDLCLRLEEQVKAVTQEGGLLLEYQKARDRVRELEEQLETCRKTVTEYDDKIQLLEVEVNVLLGVGSLSLSSSFSDGWATDPEQEDSGGLGSQ